MQNTSSVLSDYQGQLKKVNNYTINWLISGSNESTEGSIYLGSYENQIVAIKVFFDHKELSFYRQMQAYDLLKESPWVANAQSVTQAQLLFDTYKGLKVEKKPVVIMEYAEKFVLYWYVAINKCRPLSEGTCRRFTRMLIQGIRDMDAKKIGHRDLKLENIILTKNYSLKIIDFGHAQKSKDEKNDYIIYSFPPKKPGFGTTEYRTPEAASGKEFTLIEYDIYALGVILFLLRTKTYPFDEIGDKKHTLFLKDNDKFWQNTRKETRKKGIEITADFIYLINSFLSENRWERPTLDKLQPYKEEYEWFKGEESTEEETMEEMQKIYGKLVMMKKFQAFNSVVRALEMKEEEY